MKNRGGNDGWSKQILAQTNDNRRIFLCEYGIVHLKWDENELVYCPGDFIGLSFLLSSLLHSCSLECAHDDACPNTGDDGTVHLSWNRMTLHLNPKEFRQVLTFLEAATKASKSLSEPRFACLMADDQSFIQLWLLGVGFYLSPDDFLMMVALMRLAARGRRQMRPMVKHSMRLTYMKNISDTKFWLN